MTTEASTSTKSSKRPWLLVFLNAGALLSSIAQMRHLYLMLGAS
jgi:hypothetical protein